LKIRVFFVSCTKPILIFKILIFKILNVAKYKEKVEVKYKVEVNVAERSPAKREAKARSGKVLLFLRQRFPDTSTAQQYRLLPIIIRTTTLLPATSP
jgi:hypothetical protein